MHFYVKTIFAAFQHGIDMGKEGEFSEVIDASPGIAITIPRGINFQFRNTEWEPLSFICVDSPKWPAHSEEAKSEALPVPGIW